MSNCPEKNENLDQVYCKLISKSIADVIHFSLDESFRKRSFELFGVHCNADTEKEIYKKLTALIENTTATQNRDKEDKVVLEDLFNQTSNTDADKISEVKSKNKERNWLQISSKQYQESIKRKRARLYSQPENEIDFFDCNNYQPSNKAVLPLLKPFNLNFKENFNNSFNYNRKANIKFFSQ